MRLIITIAMVPNVKLSCQFAYMYRVLAPASVRGLSSSERANCRYNKHMIATELQDMPALQESTKKPPSELDHYDRYDRALIYAKCVSCV